MMPSFSTTLLGRELEGDWVETVEKEAGRLEGE